MLRGLYAAASGMLAQQTIQETLAQNIANANTVGYKQDTPTFRAMHGMAISRLVGGQGRGSQIGDLGMGVQADQVYTDWQTGPLAETHNPLDASLGTNQFFAVSTPDGERYTRAGNFQMDGAGRLMTAGGLPVLDANNQPVVARGQGPFALDSRGNLTGNGATIARLKIVQIDPASLSKAGGTLFTTGNAAGVRTLASPTVRPGTLEQSNANPVMDMVRLINVSRGFDMAQRAIITQDEMLRHATSEVGKL